MQTKFNKRALCGAAAAALMLLAGTAQAALQDRDLNGDTLVDAFYDTDLDITWLRDANVNGPMQWGNAVIWADAYSVGGYTDWRLPTSDSCFGYNCTSSEMGHLWYTELGNAAGEMTSTGDFQNLQRADYWLGTEDAQSPTNAWIFSAINGLQYTDGKNLVFGAMAVHSGDIGTPAVPEPQTLALMLAGLSTLALLVRRRPR